MDLECFEIKKIQFDKGVRLYSPSFKLPPVFDKRGKKRSRKSQPDSENGSKKWNMDYVVNYVTYICLGWMATSGVPFICHSVGLIL
ncbi:hypothetical protein OS493_008232 [Desmophyllum pertusum]|uniref:Uncharacterized protein n=1 Tax=Desmophyllum pertusum TaxID=174260 RepID=A0A9X0A3Z7_9CNID|nr:hypothetical protein OS493_008232 [Desmophyllum pertusum]